MTKKIYRSESDRMIAGICGGIGEYFDIDPTLVRIIFAFILLSGSGFILYIILWVVIPSQSQVKNKGDENNQEKNTSIKPFYVTEYDTKKGKK
jgi:phage shock protein PspC (stress-responsive transcriptional regulator)